MTDESRPNPDDEFREMLRAFLQGQGMPGGGVDPSQLAGAAGLPNDPATLARLMQQLQAALNATGEGIDWQIARDQAAQIATRSTRSTEADERAALEQAVSLAAMWLDEAVSVAELTTAPRLLSRAEWTSATMPVWSELATPVATSIADALMEVLRDAGGDDLGGMMAGAGRMMRNLGGTLFAMQLGQVVGQLSTEVVSGGDIGLPLLEEQQAALVTQNVADFGEGLEVPDDEVRLYLSVRELAHARLFRHARWLRLHVLSSITEYARGIRIDTERLEELARSFDPSNPEELRQAMTRGELIPPKSDEQQAALARLETTLALIEGWVDVVTADATQRLPAGGSIAETVRRRRAAGGPAERALGSLVGLELRPRRLREAAALWRLVGERLGVPQRDQLWSHPDLLPTAEEIDDPERLIARLTAPAPEPDEMDRALEELLRGEAGRASDDPSDGEDGHTDDDSR